MQLVLPYPPSLNRYYRTYKGRMLIAKEGREYRTLVCKTLMVAKRMPSLVGDLEMSIHIYPPDRRRRDIDNVLKALLDAMGKAGVYLDDSQIKTLKLEMHYPANVAHVIVFVEERQNGSD